MISFKRHKKRKETQYKTTGKVIYDEFDQKPSKSTVDEIDRVLKEPDNSGAVSNRNTTKAILDGIKDKAFQSHFSPENMSIEVSVQAPV